MALKDVNEEPTVSLETLLHGRCGLVRGPQVRTAQRGSMAFAWTSTNPGHPRWVELARCRSDLSLPLLADACCVVGIVGVVLAAGALAPIRA